MSAGQPPRLPRKPAVRTGGVVWLHRGVKLVGLGESEGKDVLKVIGRVVDVAVDKEDADLVALARREFLPKPRRRLPQTM